MKNFIFTVLVLSFCLHAEAQKSSTAKNTANQTSALSVQLQAYSDSLRNLKLTIDSLRSSLDSTQQSVMTSRYYSMFSPLSFNPGVTRNMLHSGSNSIDGSTVDYSIEKALMSTYLSRPDLVQTTYNKLKESAEKSAKIDEVPLVREVKVKEETPVKEEVILPEAPVDLVVVKPNFWTFNGDYSLQFNQNHVSNNWYQGGASLLALVASAKLQYNYNNKKKLKWENELDMRFGVQSLPSDTVHSMKTSIDQLRYTGKIGIQAAKQWYYTLQAIATTQFAKGFKNNDKTVYSDFLAPLSVNVSVGMDYSWETKNKKFKGDIHIGALAYNWKYTRNVDLATRNGIKEGHHSLQDYGSQLTLKFQWKPSDSFRWESRIYGFTTYHRTEFEFENTFTLQFNRYISTKLFLYPRFYDCTKKIDNTYWQFKEYISLGFSYSM